MKATGALLSACGVLAALTQAGSARACGSEVAHYYAADTYTQGDDVPLNAPIVIDVKPVGDAPGAELWEPTLTLTKAGSNTPVMAKSIGFQIYLKFLPPQLLEPHTTYQLSLDNLPGPDGTTQPSTKWELTTGATAAPVLALSGKLQVTLEAGTDPVMDCSNLNDCGSGCVDTGKTLDVTKARVKLPQAVGGFAKRFGELLLTDNIPHDFSLKPDQTPHEVSWDQLFELDPSVTEIVLTLPTEDQRYRPCFAYAVEDARADRVFAEPLCLDLFPIEAKPETGSGPGGSASVPTNTATPEASDGTRTSSGCALGAGSQDTNRGVALALLVTCSSVLARRRRFLEGVRHASR